MEFNINKVCSKESDEKFFAEHKFEVVSACMEIQPSSGGMLDSARIQTKIEAMNRVAEKHNYGPFSNVCDNCTKSFPNCNANMEKEVMRGWINTGDNICFCKVFKPM